MDYCFRKGLGWPCFWATSIFKRQEQLNGYFRWRRNPEKSFGKLTHTKKAEFIEEITYNDPGRNNMAVIVFTQKPKELFGSIRKVINRKKIDACNITRSEGDAETELNAMMPWLLDRTFCGKL